MRRLSERTEAGRKPHLLRLYNAQIVLTSRAVDTWVQKKARRRRGTSLLWSLMRSSFEQVLSGMSQAKPRTPSCGTYQGHNARRVDEYTGPA